MSARDPHWWCINGVPINVLKMQLMQTGLFVHFLPGPLHPIHVTWSRDSVHMSIIIMSMAVRSSNLKRPKVWSQPPDRRPCRHGVPTSKGPWRDGSIGQLTSHLPSCSPARGLLPNHPNTRYCLGIHVTLTEETGVVPPLSHAWTAFSGRYALLCLNRTHWSCGNQLR